ncbi:MAG: hypothetical protein O7G85_16545 [Planctomycetota bacterium]|nr:hypothetical protein [Planctomycetota bacterium]
MRVSDSSLDKAILILVSLYGSGCAAIPEVEAPEVSSGGILHHAGGRHHRLLVEGNFWYQSRGDHLEVISPSDGSLLNVIRIGEPGLVGRMTALLLLGHELIVVLHDDGVARFDLTEPSHPRLVELISARELDLMPRQLSLVDDEVYVSGRGGIVRLSDRQRVYTNLGEAGPVAKAIGGLVTSVGRRVYRLDDEQYLGSASRLLMLPRGYGVPGHLLFIRDEDNGSSLGLMNAAIREVDINRATVHVDGSIHAVKFIEGLVWAAHDGGLLAWRIDGDRLRQVHDFDLAGIRDFGAMGTNQLTLCGEFGRGLYRIADDGRNPGPMMIWKMDLPGTLSRTRNDNRYLVASDLSRQWVYDIRSNDVTRLIRDVTFIDPESDDHAGSLRAEAWIEEEGRELRITMDLGELTHIESEGSRMHCVISVKGRFWLGHDRGVTVLDPGQAHENLIVQRFRLPGAIIHLMPLLSGEGAAYVSESGGFGVITFSR